MDLLKALLVSEIAPDWCDDPDPVEEGYVSPEQQMRDKSPALQEAYRTYKEAQEKYEMLHKLLKTTEKFR